MLRENLTYFTPEEKIKKNSDLESSNADIMASYQDVKMNFRFDSGEYKRCFIAKSITSHSDILQAIYKRFGKDLKIRSIQYKG